MATTDELNADFDAAYKDLDNLIRSFIPDRSIPFVGNIRDIASQKLHSPEGKSMLLKVIRDVIAADEKWRAAHQEVKS